MASVKKLLADREWIESGPAGFGPIQVAVLPLLEEWVRAYRPERNSTSAFYSIKPIPEVEARLAEFAKSHRNQVAFTAFSGAVRYQRATAYVAENIDTIAETLALMRVNSGSNVTLIEPYDEGVFFGTRELAGAPVVSPIQIYLDLIRIKGRGEEAAASILDEVILPLWQ